MDTDQILEKLIKWISEPRGRAIIKTLVYLVVPLIVILALRKVSRRSTTMKTSSAIQPKIRPATTENLSSAESLKETMARQQKKIARELREVFGREDSLLAKVGKNKTLPAASRALRTSESPEANEKNMLQEELLKLFSRRSK